MSELNIDVSHRSCPCEKCEKNIIFHGCRYVTLSFTSFHMLALDLEGVHDVKLHHPSSSVATSNQ